MNSPLMTAVVGTSTTAPPPNAPLTPAMTLMMARPAAEPMMVRLLLRHMPLYRHSRLQTRRDNRFVIVHRAHCHGARADVVSVQHAYCERVSFEHDGVARHHDDVVFPFELHVDRG